MSRALREEPTARAGVARMLHEAAEFTDPSRPPRPCGCLVISPAVTCTAPEVESALRDQRNANLAAIEALVTADIDAGELPRTADARALARFSGAVLQGMSQQARDGAAREELEAVAEHAMRAWSSVAATDR